MKCPYLRNSPPRCTKMIEKGLDGKLTDFDIEHFCDGNPVRCYFYRVLPSEEKEQGIKKKFPVILRH